MSKVVIMIGIPGAGKSTHIKNNYPGSIVCSADHFFIKDGKYRFNPRLLGHAHDQCFNNFKTAIYKYAAIIGDVVIVVDNTNTRIKEMRPYIELAQKYGYQIEVVVLKCDPQIAFIRNIHDVPLDAIQKMAARIENTLTLIPAEWNCKVIDNERD